MQRRSPQNTAFVFSGGVGLGSYQAGAFERFCEEHEKELDWVAGSSVGSVNAALIAGSQKGQRIGALKSFWTEENPWKPTVWPAGRHAMNWASAIQTRLVGASGYFRPRIPATTLESFKSLYDLTPMRARLEKLIDLSALNSGDVRVTIATTDIESGELVIFDTAKGHTITFDHLMASCGFLPEFPLVEIEGRLLGDGGLAANAPIEAVLADGGSRNVFVVDLFARDGVRPTSLETAVLRKNDIVFGNQTLRRLEVFRDFVPHRNRVFYLSYRPNPEEAGPERGFDLSRDTATSRWQIGRLDMEMALTFSESKSDAKLTIIRRGNSGSGS